MREYRLYYKGRQRGLAPNQTRMGLAIASRPEGPYTRYQGNPVLDSGHEVCVWPHGTGVGCIVAPCGPQGSTLQYSADGLCFRRVRAIEPPRAPGPCREDRWKEGSAPGHLLGPVPEHGFPLALPAALRHRPPRRAPLRGCGSPLTALPRTKWRRAPRRRPCTPATPQ